MRRTIAPEILVERTPPAHVGSGEDVIFSHEYQKLIVPCTVVDLQHVDLLPNGFVSKRSSLWVLSESFTRPPRTIQVLKNLIKTMLFRLRGKTGTALSTAVLACDENSNGYFHWLGDVLPRLELAVQSGMNASTMEVLVPFMAQFPYVLPSLEPFGFGAVVLPGPAEICPVEELHVIGATAPTGNYRPDLMQRLRKRLVAFYAPHESNLGKPRRLFISRERAVRRKIIDEFALTSVLDRFGIQRVCMEDLDFAAQVRLCAGAELIVGLHGAGLSNMLFAPAGCTILEIRYAGDRHNNCYFSLASALNQPYHYVLAQKLDPTSSVQDADALLDPAVLERALATLALTVSTGTAT